jgi:peroxiredoxin (alkyl hydroperoxide reductase subunit C)
MSILVGKKAPDFTTQAVLCDGTLTDDFNLSKALEGKYGVLFFYPMDFTHVCPTEIIAMDKRMHELDELGCEVVGVSIDSHFTHRAYRNTDVNDGGIGEVSFTLAADMTHEIGAAYGILSDGGDSYYPAGVAMRATFIIDKNGIVRHQVVNDEPLGRNMDNVVRTVAALQYFEKNGRVCPAGWTKGDEGFDPTKSGVANYLSNNASSL